MDRVPLIDLHCHILPGVDDGARDDAAALAMLRAAQEEGIGTVVATPHAHHCPAAPVRAGIRRLSDLATAAGIRVALAPGHEVRLSARLIDLVRAGDVLTLGDGPYLLLELPLGGPWPSYLVTVVRNLQRQGIRPVLAHAERYDAVQRDPAVLRGLLAAGVPIQINADSLAGPAERGAQPAAEHLIRTRQASLLASDAHTPGALRRLRPALARAAELAGADYVTRLIDNAAASLRGTSLALPPSP